MCMFFGKSSLHRKEKVSLFLNTCITLHDYLKESMLKHRIRPLIWALALLYMIGMAGAATTVPLADILYLKAKVEAHQPLSLAEIELAKQINETTGSYIPVGMASTPNA